MNDMGELGHQAVRGSVLSFAGQGGKFLVRVATQVLIARLLLPADYGLIAMVTPILALSQLMGDLGLGQAAVIQRDITAPEISSLFWFGLLLNVLLATGLMLVAPALAWLYGEPRVQGITLVLAGLLPIQGLAMQPLALLQREMRFHALAVLDVVPLSLALIGGWWAALSGWGYQAILVALAIEAVVTTLLALGLARWRPARPGRLHVGRLLRVGGHLTLFNLALYLQTSVDAILLGVLQGDTALGLYNRGYRLITQPIGQLMIPMSRVAVPLLGRLHGEPERYRQTWADMATVTTLVSAPAMLFIMVMARSLAVFVLGPQWAAVAPIFAWLCLAGLSFPVQQTCNWLFVTQGQTRRQAHYGIASTGILVLAFIAGLPWGPVGVSAGVGLASVGLVTPLTCWGATRRSVVRLGDMMRSGLPLALAMGITAQALVLARPAAPAGVLGLLGMATIAYGVFIASLAALPFSWPMLRRAWSLARA